MPDGSVPTDSELSIIWETAQQRSIEVMSAHPIEQVVEPIHPVAIDANLTRSIPLSSGLNSATFRQELNRVLAPLINFAMARCDTRLLKPIGELVYFNVERLRWITGEMNHSDILPNPPSFAHGSVPYNRSAVDAAIARNLQEAVEENIAFVQVDQGVPSQAQNVRHSACLSV
jgi:hypothetical protein